MGKITILGTGLTRSKKPGMAIPAVVLFEQFLLLNTGNAIQIIGVDDLEAVTKNKQNILSSDIIIINSLSTLLNNGSELLLKLLRTKKVFLYLHETEYVLDYSDKYYQQRMSIFWRSLPNIGLLCSTQQQQDFYHRLGLTNTSVIFNSLNLNPAYTWQRDRVLSEDIHVVMIGSIQKRKGVVLFDQVANILTQTNPRYKFTWIGGHTDREDGDYKFSKCVKWIERISAEDIYDIYSQADVFFLSSIDDPLPLSATEAAAAGLRVVAYEGTGTHETLSGCNGFVAFSTYSPEHASEAIIKVISNHPKSTDYSKVSVLFASKHFAVNAWRAISDLVDRVPSFTCDEDFQSTLRRLEANNDIIQSPLLTAYGLPTEIFLEYATKYQSQINLEIISKKVKTITEGYAGQISPIYGFEAIGVAKLLLFCKEYEECCEFILQRIHSGVSINNSVALTLAALEGLQARVSEYDWLGEWFMPRLLESIKSVNQQPFLYTYASKVLMQLGYHLVAERYLKRASDLSPSLKLANPD